MLPIRYSEIKDHPGLLAEYEDECSIPALGKPNPQWDMYEQMQASGILRVFGVYCDAVLVGFSSLFVTILPHYGFKAATVESLFVSKAHRSSGAGARLMIAIEGYARGEDCRLILYSCPTGGELEAVLGKRMERASGTYCKRLGGE